MLEEKVIYIQGKKYDLKKLKDEDLLKIEEYIIKRGNFINKKLEQLN